MAVDKPKLPIKYSRTEWNDSIGRRLCINVFFIDADGDEWEYPFDEAWARGELHCKHQYEDDSVGWWQMCKEYPGKACEELRLDGLCPRMVNE